LPQTQRRHDAIWVVVDRLTKSAHFLPIRKDYSGYWASLRIEPDLISRIKEAQKEDSEIWTIVENLDKQVEFRLDDDNVLWQDTRLVVPNDATLREALLTEAHSSPFSVHLSSTKMYHNLKQYFWWSGMKRDVVTFVARCLMCQQVKIEHQRASGLLQQLDIPVWKWDEISMDFVTGLPQTQRRHDAIWVVVDRLTKSAHFLPIRKDYSVSRLTESLGNQAQVQYCLSSPDRRSERAYYSDTGGHREWEEESPYDSLVLWKSFTPRLRSPFEAPKVRAWLLPRRGSLEFIFRGRDLIVFGEEASLSRSKTLCL
nr:retrotransposon protein, putative, Ty3-gypsy subclass [Tanacetum cinerariifolium]